MKITYGLVLAHLGSPNIVYIRQTQSSLFDEKPNDLLQLFHVLRLMHGVLEGDLQHFVLLQPGGHGLGREEVGAVAGGGRRGGEGRGGGL